MRAYSFPFDLTPARHATHIIEEVRGLNRVAYDVTNDPLYILYQHKVRQNCWGQILKIAGQV
jgi:hypothetical protein